VITSGYTRACLGREPPGKPDAGNPHVRFDEGEGVKPLPTLLNSADDKLLEAFGSLITKPRSKKFNERIFRCLEWFRYAHVDSDEVSKLSKIVMMATAFEMALDVPDNEPQKQRFIAEKLEKEIGCSGLRKSTRRLGKRKKTEVTHTKLGWWARDFYNLRNSIVHGDVVDESRIIFQKTNIQWMTHFIMADLILYHYIKKLLLDNRYWGNDLRARLGRTGRKHFPDDPGGYVEAMVNAILGADDIFRTLGWMPPIPNTAVAGTFRPDPEKLKMH